VSGFRGDQGASGDRGDSKLTVAVVVTGADSGKSGGARSKSADRIAVMDSGDSGDSGYSVTVPAMLCEIAASVYN
jgi:hypothetical protein